MLTIRLTRKGKKNQPFFRVVLVDKRSSSKSGKAIEDLGFKNPLTKKVSLNKDRILYWISKGAKPTPTIHNYLVSEKIVDAKKINVSKKSKKPAEVAVTPAPATAPATVKPAEPVVAEKKEEPAVEAKPVEAPKEEPKA